MAVADTIRIEVVWRLGGVDFAENVLHYTTGAADPIDDADVAIFGTEFETVFGSSGLRAEMSNAIQLHRVVARDLRTDGNGPLTFLIESTGTVVSNPLPPQDCVVTTLRTTNGSRRGRGRIYWPGNAANQTTAAGQVDPTAITAFGAFMDAILTMPMGTPGNVVLGVYSRADDVTRTVVSHITDTVYDVQTRRRDLSIT